MMKCQNPKCTLKPSREGHKRTDQRECHLAVMGSSNQYYEYGTVLLKGM